MSSKPSGGSRVYLEVVVGGKYRVGKKIGSGGFGELTMPVQPKSDSRYPGDIYLGVNIVSGEEVAIKLEPVTAKAPQLQYETEVYQALAGGLGVPFVRWYGTQSNYNAMVMDLL